MVRFINAVVTIYAESTTENADGDIIQGFSQVEVVEGDVQPANLSQEELKLYGISTIRGNIKKFFYNGIHQNIKAGNRAVVNSSLTGKSDIYSIMPVNCWTRHGVCLLVPIENEVWPPAPEPTPNTEGETDGNQS